MQQHGGGNKWQRHGKQCQEKRERRARKPAFRQLFLPGENKRIEREAEKHRDEAIAHGERLITAHVPHFVNRLHKEGKQQQDKQRKRRADGAGRTPPIEEREHKRGRHGRRAEHNWQCGVEMRHKVPHAKILQQIVRAGRGHVFQK